MVCLAVLMVGFASVPQAAVSIEVSAAGLDSARGHSAYLGSLHSHTSYSDGSGTPEEAFEMSRTEALMDFFAVTEHNHADADGKGRLKDGITLVTRPDLYAGPAEESLRSAANRATEPGKFIALYGQEFSTISKGNHVNVFDAPTVIDVPNGRFDQLDAWLDQNRALDTRRCPVQLNHPWDDDGADAYGQDDFSSKEQWKEKMSRYVHLIDVLNGPGQKDGSRLKTTMKTAGFFKFLRDGWQLGPTANQDNHRRNWGTSTDARTGLIAAGLTKRGLFAAMRNRHTYASQDRDLRLAAWINGRLIGSNRVSRNGDTVTVDLRIADLTEPNAEYTVEVYSAKAGAEITRTDRFSITGDSARSSVWRKAAVPVVQDSAYALLKVIQKSSAGSDTIWSAPVWFR